MTDVSPAPDLDALRRELDDVDDALLRALARRFAITAQVRALKQAGSEAIGSPLRPAREAAIHRRMLQQAQALGVPTPLALQLWRAILTQSSLGQAPMTLHVSGKLSQTLGNRLRLRDHFPGMAVEEWKDDATVLTQVNVNAADICAVEVDSGWIDPFIQGKAGDATIIAALPILHAGDRPDLLILGRAPSEATGNDETLLITQGNLPRDFAVQPSWQVKCGAWRLSALAGFFSEHEGPLVGLSRSNVSLGLKVAGRYPSAIEI
jgi:chorismate mutase / prephenate dehydratase